MKQNKKLTTSEISTKTILAAVAIGAFVAPESAALGHSAHISKAAHATKTVAVASHSSHPHETSHGHFKEHYIDPRSLRLAQREKESTEAEDNPWDAKYRHRML